MTETPQRKEIGTQTNDSYQRTTRTVYTQTEIQDTSRASNILQRQKTTLIKEEEEESEEENIINNEEREEENIINNEEREEENNGESGSTSEQNGEKNNKDEEIKTIISLININILIYNQMFMLLNMQHIQTPNKTFPFNNAYYNKNFLINLILENLCQKGFLNRSIYEQCGNYGFNVGYSNSPIKNNQDYFYNQPIPRNGLIIPNNNLTYPKINDFNSNNKNNNDNKNLDNTKNDSNKDLDKDKDANKDGNKDDNKDKNKEDFSIKSEVSIDTGGLLPILITGGLTATTMCVCPIMAPLALVAFLVFLYKNPESLLGKKKGTESKKEEEKKKEPIKTPKKDEKSEEKSESSEKQEKKDQKTQNETPKNQNQEKSGPTTDPLPEPPNRNTQTETHMPNSNEQNTQENNELLEQEELKEKVKNIENAKQDIAANIPYQQIPIKA